MQRPLILLIGLALIGLATAPAQADGEIISIITKFDDGRLERFAATKAKAVAEARAKGDPQDVALLDAALAGSPLDINANFDATGRWKCRVMKLGKLLPLVVYPKFKCRITDDGSGWVLHKLTGSQRTSGKLYTAGPTSLTYLGAGTVNDDPERTYNDDPQYNEVALVERLGKRKLVFQFPEPQFESLFDLLVLER